MLRNGRSLGTPILSLAIAIAFMLSGPAFAQDVEAGHQIAKTWCAGCHLVGREDQKIASDATPSFVSVAKMKATTITGLEVFLSTPHTRMPDYTLTRDEMRDVSAYILSLKSASGSR